MKASYLKNVYFYIFVIITAIVLSVFNPFFISSIHQRLELINYYENVQFDYTLTVDSKKQDCYIIIDENFFAQAHEDGSMSEYINATTLMLTNVEYSGIGYYNEKNIYEGVYGTLGKNECSITHNIAEKRNLSIGDPIYYYNDETKEVHELIIINILSDTYDFLDPSIDSNPGYIFCGYDDNLFDEIRYLSFAVFSDETDLNARDLCYVITILKNNYYELTIQFIIMIILIVTLTIIYYIFNKKDVVNMLRLYNLGYKKSRIILYLSMESLFTIIILIIIGIIPSIILDQILYYIVEVIVIILIIYIKNLIGIWRRL